MTKKKIELDSPEVMVLYGEKTEANRKLSLKSGNKPEPDPQVES